MARYSDEFKEQVVRKMNIVLNILLLPGFGVMGAAYATGLSMVICNIWLAHHFHVKIGVRTDIFSGMRHA